jgi:glycosyltransferase involved in cell wall biosynthesis
MFRIGKTLPIVVVAPQPWFPLQGLVRLFRKHFRPMAPRFEVSQGFEIHRPWFLCFPGIFKWSDGLFMALCSWPTVRRLARRHAVNIVDAHFGYPDGYAASLLARWLRLPLILTLRGKEERLSRTVVRRPLCAAIRSATRVIAVSEALRQFAVSVAGIPPQRTIVIGNGVDLAKFHMVDRSKARQAIAVPSDAQILISVGTLVERKGFHRVIACLPALLARHPKLHYLIVGGSGPEGDITAMLKRQVAELGLTDHVSFLGAIPPERLREAYSAADVFVLATSYEGWANVFLEAMACGLPVVTTLVGGNSEVVSTADLGVLVPLGDQAALTSALDQALHRHWDRDQIRAYAQRNSWENRISTLAAEFVAVVQSAHPDQKMRGA